MKLFASISLAAALTLSSAAASAAPTVITFDDIVTSSYAQIANGYAGLNWDNFYVLNGPIFIPDTGYTHGTVSSPNVAYNRNADSASFSSATAFTLLSVDVTKAWKAGITHFDGYVGNTLTYSMDVTSSTVAPTLATFNWANLNKVTVSDGNETYQSAFDNLTISAVPEPDAYGMLLVGLGLIGFMARRKFAA